MITTMHLMVSCINTVLIPLAASNTTVRREMEKTTNMAIVQMEEKVNSLMQRTIDVAIIHVTKLLNSQSRTDFRPRDDGIIAELQTPVSSKFSYPSHRANLTPQFFIGSSTKSLTTHPDLRRNSLLPDQSISPFRPRPSPRLTKSGVLPHRACFPAPTFAAFPLWQVPDQCYRWHYGSKGHFEV